MLCVPLKEIIHTCCCCISKTTILNRIFTLTRRLLKLFPLSFYCFSYTRWFYFFFFSQPHHRTICKECFLLQVDIFFLFSSFFRNTRSVRKRENFYFTENVVGCAIMLTSMKIYLLIKFMYIQVRSMKVE